jgi:hypothetical protein
VKLTKQQSRERWGELRDLACEWDPIGVISIGAPRDEYDCLLGTLLRLLEGGADEDKLFKFLDAEMKNHFGLPFVPTTRDFAKKVTGWYRTKWPDSNVQEGVVE